MPAYVIAELREGERGGYAPRGAVKALWQSRDFETLVSGPAETGKTWGCLHYADALLWKYPGAQGVVARKVLNSLAPSALRTYKRILGPDTPVRAYGGEKPEWFDYPNGSRLWVAGLDNPGKALSSERDFIYVNQAEELVLEDWETLTTRCTGRGAVMPYTRIFGDCNPGPPSHWIKARQAEGKLRLLESRHEDNPSLYDDDLKLTPQGAISLSILDNLTGTRLQRLRFGRWVQAEGAVYEQWDPNLHLIDAMPAGWEQWRKIRSIDFGYTNPFVCGWWAVDADDRMILYRQIYRTGRLVEDHAADIVRLSEGETYEATVADHDAEDRATLERHGVRTKAAWKDISPGIQATAKRLKKAGDGRVRLQILRSSLVERDEDLFQSKKPYATEQEPEVYVWPKGADGKALKEVPVDVDNHGMDMTRYAVAYVDRLGRRKAEVY
jgi:PBSX family phage terminase large subunit